MKMLSIPNLLTMAVLGLTVLSLKVLSPGTAFADELAPPRCDYGSPHPEAPAELQQFAFLIGDYTIKFHAWRSGKWTPPQPGATGRWNGYYGLGGMAIIDEWFDRDPGLEPNVDRGVNVRMWDDEASEWDMMWMATAGKQVQDLRAQMKDGKLTMWQVYPDRPNFKAVFEITDDDHWARISYTKDDDGEWVKQFKLAATRIPCTD